MIRSRALWIGLVALGLAVLAPWRGRFVPDFTVLAVVLVAAARPRLESVLFATAAGVVLGSLSAAAFGSRALVLAILAYLVGGLASRVEIGSPPLLLAAGLAATLTAAWLGGLVLHLVTRESVDFAAAPALGQALATGLAAVLAGSWALQRSVEGRPA